jgi:hypothetical protein
MIGSSFVWLYTLFKETLKKLNMPCGEYRSVERNKQFSSVCRKKANSKLRIRRTLMHLLHHTRRAHDLEKNCRLLCCYAQQTLAVC